MSEYIEREDVEKAIADIRGVYHKARNFNAVSAIDNAAGEIRECVKNADVAPVVHGHWKYPKSQDPICSVCGCSYDREEGGYAPMTDYCGNCGAKMDGGDTK